MLFQFERKIKMRHFILFICIYIEIVALLFYPGTVKAEINNQIKEMLHDGQHTALYKDKDIGKAVISIGFAQNANNDIAIDIAKHVAMKYLAAFLKGEKVSATEAAEQSMLAI